MNEDIKISALDTKGNNSNINHKFIHPVWRAWTIVAFTLVSLFAAYAWRSYAFLQDRVKLQTKAVATLARIQVINTFPLVDKSLLSAKNAFESLGPGIDEGALTQASLSVVDPQVATFKCMVLINGAGDPYLRTPELCQLPDMTEWTEQIRLSSDFDQNGIYTMALVDKETNRQFLVRGIPLQFQDRSFAGIAVASLDTDKIFGLFSEFGTGGFKNVFLPGDALNHGTQNDPKSSDKDQVELINITADIPLRVKTPAGPGQLLLQVGTSKEQITREWILGMYAPVTGLLLMLSLLAYWARTTHKALLKKTNSDLMVRRARIEAEIQARFFACMSHELRTPMNGVVVAAELLNQTVLRQDQSHLVGLITRSGKLLVSIVNDILDSSKISAGQLMISNENFNLHQILQDVVELLRPQANNKKLQFNIDLQIPAGLQAKGDAKRMQQIIINLLSNAIKFTNKGEVKLSARIDLSAPARGDLPLTIVIKDTGIGFDVEQAHWLYKPFQQADDSISRRFGGTGLGLSISQQMTQLLGGRIHVESVLGQGTCFSVLLPLNDVQQTEFTNPVNLQVLPSEQLKLDHHAEAENTDRCSDEQQETRQVRLKQLALKVLVVEDNMINLQLAQMLLRGLGCQVQTATNGQEAVDKTKQFPFDVVLMDCQMPIMDGLEATRQIRSRDKAIPIIALTAQTLPEDVQQCLASGMNDYCHKPIDKSLLVEKILQFFENFGPTSAN